LTRGIRFIKCSAEASAAGASDELTTQAGDKPVRLEPNNPGHLGLIAAPDLLEV
jgi:hypothetical protein